MHRYWKSSLSEEKPLFAFLGWVDLFKLLTTARQVSYQKSVNLSAGYRILNSLFLVFVSNKILYLPNYVSLSVISNDFPFSKFSYRTIFSLTDIKMSFLDLTDIQLPDVTATIQPQCGGYVTLMKSLRISGYNREPRSRSSPKTGFRRDINLTLFETRTFLFPYFQNLAQYVGKPGLRIWHCKDSTFSSNLHVRASNTSSVRIWLVDNNFYLIKLPSLVDLDCSNLHSFSRCKTLVSQYQEPVWQEWKKAYLGSFMFVPFPHPSVQWALGVVW